MRRTPLISLAIIVGLSAFACLTEETKCPAGHKRMRGLCVADEDAGRDAGEEADAADPEDSSKPPTACYLDFDHDGVGAGDEVDCDDPFADLPDASVEPDATDAKEADASTEANLPDASVEPDATDAGETDASTADATVLPAVVDRNDDCDDHDSMRAPILKELCDGVDNNCNDEVDDNAKNACGGTCTRVLDHTPGEACENGQQGACARSGKYICQGDTDVVCNAPEITASSELCGDEIDNDCDGVTDEPDAVNAPLWYQDCDGDGYATSLVGALQSCSKPVNAGACGWTQVIPQPTTRTNWDCNDGSAAYKPGAAYGFPPEGFLSWDLNCDGIVSAKDPIVTDFPSRNPDIFVCSGPLIARLNANNRDCDVTSDHRWNGCILWKAADGTYTDKPSSKCPDTEVYSVSVQTEVLDPWGFNYVPTRHQTTCRASSNRLSQPRTSTSARRSDRIEGKTTPGASYCSVGRVNAPVWPCR